MDEPLKALREAIDEIDRRLVALLSERARLAQEVGRVKDAAELPVYRPEREAQVLRNVAAANRGPLHDTGLAAVFREVMSACRALERRVRVAFLGPSGTFSEAALLKQFGSSVEAVPCVSIDEVFRSVEAGGADFAVAPVENSTEGSVTRTLDLLLATPLSIVAEVSLPIEHQLLTASGGMQGVTRICAHAQALAQCVNWLNRHYPSVERQPVASNGEAARLASADATVAAVAGEAAAGRYGLLPVASHIQDDPANRTRFVVLGRQRTRPSGSDKTSLILAVAHRAGAVHHMLAPLAVHGVSMTRFESRPARTGAWEYYFYVDVEGHELDPQVAAALAQLRGQCAFYKSLGSYPVAA
ncbi:MAG: prephenate dehydratase [Burkholderiaceae bacterium]|nr:prephenate dehydratase [Burkholderiaceae bacterium]